MSGAKMYDNQFTAGARAQITPDEIDRYETYMVLHPGTAANAIGTAAAGTQTASTAYVITNLRPDYPRNLLVTTTGSADIGGSATINGFDQFGSPITEVIGFGTSASPGTFSSGTKIFGQVTSGTWTFATSSGQGSGTPVLGYAIAAANGQGTAGGYLFGLPSKIASVNDVKRITWDNNTTTTALLGGTVGTSTLVKVAPQHAFRGTAVLALTAGYYVTFKPTFDNSGQAQNLAGLPGTP